MKPGLQTSPWKYTQAKMHPCSTILRVIAMYMFNSTKIDDVLVWKKIFLIIFVYEDAFPALATIRGRACKWGGQDSPQSWLQVKPPEPSLLTTLDCGLSVWKSYKLHKLRTCTFLLALLFLVTFWRHKLHITKFT